MTAGKLISILILITFVLNSCGKTEPPLTPQQIRQKADSLYRIQLKTIKKRAKEDYEKRLPIELKPKVDSILKSGLPASPVPVFPDDNIGVDDTTISGTATNNNTTKPKEP